MKTMKTCTKKKIEQKEKSEIEKKQEKNSKIWLI